MTKRMLVDATHPEETRVAIVDGNWLGDFDFERASRKQLKGNIYLAKVIRIEPSLQAAFVEYGGNRHGFLPFTEIHPDYYRIPMADRPPDAPMQDDDADGDDTGEEGFQDNDVNDEIQERVEEMAEESAASDAGESPAEQETEQVADAPAAANYAAEQHPSGVPGFATEAVPDLGLITDFGNAAVGPLPSLEAPIPVETIGGEVAEEEQRVRRSPRIRYKIQEVVKRRQVMLIQVVKEERGNKGAALTTFLSLAGRYCVLMPNTDHGGGVSRKITSHQDRRRMKEILDQLEIPDGMAVILRTAGMEQEPAEIQRDLEYLLRLWNSIREETLQSTAPALIYEEANLIKRSMRDLFSSDLSEILVAGLKGYQLAVDFMRMIMPDQMDKVKLYEEPIPLFFRFNVEKQIDQLYSTTVQLRSGGYIVINPTEALVSIDVNSGRATRERHIESTALKTNIEAADEVARQLRLRDLAGLIVIDFIDMEDGRNNASVERRMKEAMRADRARLQIGRISPFGLMELSRQRLHPSLMEINFEKCPHCAGVGLIRSVDSAAISILRMIEEEGIKQGSADLTLHLPTEVALYILNQKRSALSEIERRYALQVLLHSDDALSPPDFKLERTRGGGEVRERAPAVNSDQIFSETGRPPAAPMPELGAEAPPESDANGHSPRGDSQDNRGDGSGRRRGRFGFGRGRNQDRGPDRGAERGQERGQERGAERGQDRNQDRGDRPARQPRHQNQPHPQPSAPHNAHPDANGNEAPGPIDDGNDNVGNVDGAHMATTTGAYPQADGDQQRRAGRRRGRRGGRGRRSGGAGGGAGGGQSGAPREGGIEANREGSPPQSHHQPREPRHNENRGNWNRGGETQTTPTPVVVPVSIHDIDTTPRDSSAPQQRAQPQAQAPTQSQLPPQPQQQRTFVPRQDVQIRETPRAAPKATTPPPYEIVQQPSDDKPKGGWWRKLTGQ